MNTYIHNLVKDINSIEIDISKVIFVLPNIRSKQFLKKEIQNNLKNSIWSPAFLSLKEFINEISGLKVLPYLELELELYSRCFIDSPDKHSFKKFCSYSSKVINDFNDIDFQLQDPKQVFKYLEDIENMKKVGLDENSRENKIIDKFISFYSSLYDNYIKFNQYLISKKSAYSGLAYRKAVQGIGRYIDDNKDKKIIFVGLNGLNNCEELIIRELVKSKLALTYWDCDEYFLKNSNHEAVHFIKRYINEKKLYLNEFKWVFDNYRNKKKIEIFNTSTSVEQAKYIINILKNIDTNTNKTVVVLPDDRLLITILRSIPDDIDTSQINVTMQVSLKITEMYSFIDAIFKLYINVKKSNRSKNYFYYKYILSFINSNYSYKFKGLKNGIKDEFMSKSQILELCDSLDEREFINKLIHEYISIEDFMDMLFEFTEYKKKLYKDKSNKYQVLEVKTINSFESILFDIKDIIEKYNFITQIEDIYYLFESKLKSEKISLVGDPFANIQFSGLLETRLLDFENVIIASMNENIMPPPRDYNTFIPYDLRISKNLFTHKEKTAIYSYHFYRLLQRAENIFFLYDERGANEKSEKSRYLFQVKKDMNQEIEEKNIFTEFNPIKEFDINVNRTQNLQKNIEEKVKSGISVSMLIEFISNPLNFYFNSLLCMKDNKELPYVLTPDKIGSIVHNSINELYQPFLAKQVRNVSALKAKVRDVLKENFKNYGAEYNIGKNIVVFTACENYINILLDYDKDKNSSIKSLEDEMEYFESSRNIFIKGKIDRVDINEETIEIIDYKTSKVEDTHIKFESVEDIVEKVIPTKKDKYGIPYGFQLMCYGYIYMMNNPQIDKIKLSIFSFLNIDKKIYLSISGDENISKSIMREFEDQLESIFSKLMNINNSFKGNVDLV